MPLISRLGRRRCSINEVPSTDDCVESVLSKPKINHFENEFTNDWQSLFRKN